MGCATSSSGISPSANRATAEVSGAVSANSTAAANTMTQEEAAELSRSAFPYKGEIAKTEERAVACNQLQDILHYTGAHCGRWKKKRSGKVPSAAEVDLYDLNDWLIKPATAPNKCSFVELLASGRQVPHWFVSHFWGEPLANTLKCLSRHEVLRGVDTRSDWTDFTAFFYWICAFANNQHTLENDITDDPRDTGFFKAMQLSTGVLLVLDKDSTPFSRIWCAFEISVALTHAEDREELLLLDIVTVDGDDAKLLSDGLTDDETNKTYGAELKAERESSFPLSIIQSGINVCIEKAESSVPADKRHILNCIAGRSLDDVPLGASSSYDRVNAQLGGRFAIASWKQAMEKGALEELGIPKALAADQSLESLSFDLCQRLKTSVGVLDRSKLILLGESLPASLKSLSINMYWCSKLTDDSMAELWRRLPRKLEKLHVDLMRADGYSQECLLTLAQHLPESLKGLILDVRGGSCCDLENVLDSFRQKLPSALSCLPSINCDGLVLLGDCGDAPNRLKDLLQQRLKYEGRRAFEASFQVQS